MTNSRSKGNRAEVKVVNHLKENGWPEARRYLAGDGNQPGDIDAIPGVCLEVKDQRAHRIGEWLRQAEDEARGRIPIVVMHPAGESQVGRWWAVMRVDDMLPLLRSET